MQYSRMQATQWKITFFQQKARLKIQIWSQSNLKMLDPDKHKDEGGLQPWVNKTVEYRDP